MKRLQSDVEVGAALHALVDRVNLIGDGADRYTLRPKATCRCCNQILILIQIPTGS